MLHDNDLLLSEAAIDGALPDPASTNPLLGLTAPQAASGGPGPAASYDPLTAGQQITRDNDRWAGPFGTAAAVSYGFRASAPAYSVPGENIANAYLFFPAQIAAATDAFAEWSDVANINFVRSGSGVTGSQAYSDNATILLGNYYDPTDGADGFSILPPGDASPTGATGDVWINLADPANDDPAINDYSYMGLMHEIGHSIGLEHPGAYNADPNVVLTYQNNAAYREDDLQYSTMSYFAAANTGADHVYQGRVIYASTPLLDDITAAQRLYGVNTATRLGDTVYGFNSNADRAAYRLASADDQRVFCIWDAGGFNTIDESGYSTNQVIDLNPGAFSSTGALTDNLSIALGTTIQGAVGGAGNDVFHANAASDVIDGRAGFNLLVLPGASSAYRVDVTGFGSATVTNLQSGAVDTLANVEDVRFSDTTIEIAPQTIGQPVFLFYNVDSGEHFFTASMAERNALVQNDANYEYEGPGFEAVNPATNDPSAVPVFRFLNPGDGDHFYTVSMAERNALIANDPGLKYEGAVFNEDLTPQAGDAAVYRFLELNSGGHFYTASAAERDAIVASQPNLRFEGTAFYAPTA